MDLKELGNRLRLQREQLGMSIVDISESTRISRSVLTIFEEGEVDRYPHPVYAKGFIRNYAKALGLDPVECVRVLERNLEPENEQGEQQVQRKPLSKEARERNETLSAGRSPWPAFLGAFLLAAVLGGLIWYFSFYQDTVGADHAPATHEEQAEEAPAAAAPEAVEPPREVQDTDMPAEPEQGQEPHADAQQGDAAQPLQVSASAEEQPVRSEPVDAVGASQQDAQSDVNTLIISVSGNQPCWVGVWLPGVGEIARDFTVQGGASETYRFTGERALRFGRAEAVTLTFNGKPMTLDGRGVVNLTLP